MPLFSLAAAQWRATKSPGFKYTTLHYRGERENFRASAEKAVVIGAWHAAGPLKSTMLLRDTFKRPNTSAQTQFTLKHLFRRFYCLTLIMTKFDYVTGRWRDCTVRSTAETSAASTNSQF